MTRRLNSAFVVMVMFLALLSASSAFAEPVTGVVFLDANANGQRDAGEKGVARALVTDGTVFARTDAEGRYALDATVDPLLLAADKKPILTLTFPDGTWPTAGWVRRLDAVADARNVHFGLRRIDARTPFVFIHGTDCHVPRGGKDLFPKFRAEVEALKDRLAFTVLTGDLVNLADSYPPDRALADYELFAAGARDFPVPLFAIPGNHEAAGVSAKPAWDPKHPLYGYGMYWKFVGPLRWSFNYAGVHCVGIDFSTQQDGKWSWGVPPSAVAWLRRDLERAPKGARVLLFVHSPSGDPGLVKTIQEFKVAQIFCGHSHAEGLFSVAGSRALQSGSLSQTGGDRKPGYSLVLVGKERIDHFYKATGVPCPITLDAPRGSHSLKAKSTLRGAFYDPNGQADTLTVKVGKDGAATATLPFQRTPICCRFEGELDLSAVPEGFRRLEVTVAGKGKVLGSDARSYLVLSGRPGTFEPTADAEVLIDLAGVDSGAALLANGAPLTTLGPTESRGDGPFRAPVRNAQRVTLTLPKARLRRLNALELQVTTPPGGKADLFCVLDVVVRYAGKDYRDARLARGPWHPRTVRTRATYYVDLLND